MIMNEPLLDLCPGKNNTYVLILSMIQVILVQSRTGEVSQLRGDFFQIPRNPEIHFYLNAIMLKANYCKHYPWTWILSYNFEHSLF